MRKSDLTPEQLECVEFDRHRHLLIKGQPGSGKTWVLLFRGHHLASSGSPLGSQSTRFITFTNALMKHADEMEAERKHAAEIEGNGYAGSRSSFEATTFHKWCWRLMRSLCIQKPVIDDRRRKALVRDTIEEVRLRAGKISTKVLDNPVDWWFDELKWIKGTLLADGRLVDDFSDYEHVQRTGRGSALQAGPRRLVWDVYQSYQTYLEGKYQAIDFDDYARLTVNRLNISSGPSGQIPLAIPDRLRVDHLLIDESQDLDQVQLLLLVQSARHSVTLVADEAQKIYRTPFVYESVGLAFDTKANKNVKTLKLNFRSTRHVYLLAYPLVQDERDAKEMTPPQMAGPVPRLHIAADAAEEERRAVQLAVEECQEHPQNTVALLARSWDTIQRLDDLLRQQRMTPEQIRRDENSTLTPGIKLATFHTAKGLEFDSVILFQITDGIFPPNPVEYHTEMEHEDEADFLASERRLLYVAMTRTRHMLHMTCTEPRSRFLREPYATSYETVTSAAVSVPEPANETDMEEMISLDDFDDIPF